MKYMLKPIHILYNVGCGGRSYGPEYQLVQASALEQSWSRVGQRGRLTRIVSGCHNTQEMKQTPLNKSYDLERFNVRKSS